MILYPALVLGFSVSRGVDDCSKDFPLLAIYTLHWLLVGSQEPVSRSNTYTPPNFAGVYVFDRLTRSCGLDWEKVQKSFCHFVFNWWTALIICLAPTSFYFWHLLTWPDLLNLKQMHEMMSWTYWCHQMIKKDHYVIERSKRRLVPVMFLNSANNILGPFPYWTKNHCIYYHFPWNLQ